MPVGTLTADLAWDPMQSRRKEGVLTVHTSPYSSLDSQPRVFKDEPPASQHPFLLCRGLFVNPDRKAERPRRREEDMRVRLARVRSRVGQERWDGWRGRGEERVAWEVREEMIEMRLGQLDM